MYGVWFRVVLVCEYGSRGESVLYGLILRFKERGVWFLLLLVCEYGLFRDRRVLIVYFWFAFFIGVSVFCLLPVFYSTFALFLIFFPFWYLDIGRGEIVA